MFCTSVRSRRCSTRRRKAAASSSVRVAASSVGAGIAVSSRRLLPPNMARRGRLRHTCREGGKGPGWTGRRTRRAVLRAVFDAAPLPPPIRAACCRRICRRSAGTLVVVGAGKSAALMAAAVEDAWPEVPLGRRGGHPLWPCGADAAHRGDRGRASGAGRQPARRGAADAASGAAGSAPSDLVLALISGGGSALLALPAPRPDARRQAGGEPRRCSLGRDDQRDERGAQAPLGHQGRAAGGRRGAGAGGHARDQRRAGR